MNVVVTGLVADGTSDRALIPLLRLLLKEHLQIPFEEPQFIDVERHNLAGKIKHATEKYSLDVLFVHRDAENEEWEKRVAEIQGSTPIANQTPIVSVIPIKMTEAWLLTDVQAIRSAVGNPNSNVELPLPNHKKIEQSAAKKILLESLVIACEAGANRRRRFKPEQYRQRVAELVSDLDSLRKLPSFQRLEDDLIPHLEKLNQAAAIRAPKIKA